MVCLAASTGSVATMASSIATSEQTFQIAGSPVTVAGQVLAAKLPLPANSKIVTLNMPTTQGGREHECDPFPLVLVYTCQNGWKSVMWDEKICLWSVLVMSMNVFTSVVLGFFLFIFLRLMEELPWPKVCQQIVFFVKFFFVCTSSKLCINYFYQLNCSV